MSVGVPVEVPDVASIADVEPVLGAVKGPAVGAVLETSVAPVAKHNVLMSNC